MTPKEAGAELARIFSGPPQPRGKCRWQHRQYDLVRLDDGTSGFVRNAFDAKMERIFAEVLDELFGPEPADDTDERRSPPITSLEISPARKSIPPIA